MVISLGRGADLHMTQQMPLPLTISCSSKSRLFLPFCYRLSDDSDNEDDSGEGEATGESGNSSPYRMPPGQPLDQELPGRLGG